MTSRRPPLPPLTLQSPPLPLLRSGFVQIFKPLRTDNKEDWTGSENNFTAQISHHDQPRKPFKDGWTANPQDKKAIAKAEEMEPVPADAEGNIVSFLGEAAQSVVKNNFTGDATEPEHWKKPEGAGTGWKGDIHTRDRDGFHATKQ